MELIGSPNRTKSKFAQLSTVIKVTLTSWGRTGTFAFFLMKGFHSPELHNSPLCIASTWLSQAETEASQWKHRAYARFCALPGKVLHLRCINLVTGLWIDSQDSLHYRGLVTPHLGFGLDGLDREDFREGLAIWARLVSSLQTSCLSFHGAWIAWV